MKDESSPSPASVRLAAIRHDVRNSLNVIGGALRLIETAPLTPQQQKHVEMCREAAKKIEAILSRGGDQYDDPKAAVNAGAELRALPEVSFLTKPFERSALLRTVQAAGGTRKSLRLLAADDVPEVGWLLEALLANSRCTVEVVPDGAAAVERAKSGAFDVILLDLDMPVMDGREAAHRIRERERSQGLAAVPIVIVSGHDLSPAPGTLEDPDDDAVRSDPEVAPLIPAFLENRRADAGKLHALIDAGEWPVIQAMGHKMKGTGRGYGFARISEIGRALEDAGREHDTGHARAAADALVAYLDRVQG
jgi:CheY-like chemotaxis protein/HPt (histidine-containing phosphotransfer) domain-containing protein